MKRENAMFLQYETNKHSISIICDSEPPVTTLYHLSTANFGENFQKQNFLCIYCHLCDHELITPDQTRSATHKIYSTFDEIPSKEIQAVFLDLSKAFDT